MNANRLLTEDDLPIDSLIDSLRECFSVDFVATMACISGCISKELALMPETEWLGVIATFTHDSENTLDELRPCKNALLQWLRAQRKWGLAVMDK